MTEGKWYPIFIYSEKNKGLIKLLCTQNSHNSGHCPLLVSANLIIFIVIIMIFIIGLIRTGAGPKLFGLVRFHCTTSYQFSWDLCCIIGFSFTRPQKKNGNK